MPRAAVGVMQASTFLERDGPPTRGISRVQVALVIQNATFSMILLEDWRPAPAVHVIHRS